MSRKDETKTADYSRDRMPEIDPEEVERLAAMEDAEIDTSDIAEVDPKAASEGPMRLISIRLDEGLIEFFKGGGPGYQGRIREALREHVRRRRSPPRSLGKMRRELDTYLSDTRRIADALARVEDEEGGNR